MLAIVLAMVIGFPGGWVLALMLTPLLWRLESVLHMELAGHSGPRNAIFLLGMGFLNPLSFSAPPLEGFAARSP